VVQAVVQSLQLDKLSGGTGDELCDLVGVDDGQPCPSIFRIEPIAHEWRLQRTMIDFTSGIARLAAARPKRRCTLLAEIGVAISMSQMIRRDLFHCANCTGR
jgi:hypothetical protein